MLTVSTPKWQPVTYPQPFILTNICKEMADKLESFFQQSYQLSAKVDWNLHNDHWSDTLKSLNKSKLKMAKWVMRISDPKLSLQIPGGLACLNFKMAENLIQFLPIQPM